MGILAYIDYHKIWLQEKAYALKWYDIPVKCHASFHACATHVIVMHTDMDRLVYDNVA